MPPVESERLCRPGLVTVRKGNRKAENDCLEQRRRFWPAFIGALVLVVFSMGFVWANHQSVQLSYDIASLNKERSELLDLNRKFKLELTNLTSLDRLERLSRTELGMVSPAPAQVQVIE